MAVTLSQTRVNRNFLWCCTSNIQSLHMTPAVAEMICPPKLITVTWHVQVNSTLTILPIDLWLDPEISAPSKTVCLRWPVLIDAILRNRGTAAPETDHVPPPAGWRDEDIAKDEPRNTASDEKKSYTEDQRQGVHRCWLHVFDGPDGFDFTFVSFFFPQFFTMLDLKLENDIGKNNTLAIFQCRDHNWSCRIFGALWICELLLLSNWTVCTAPSEDTGLEVVNSLVIEVPDAINRLFFFLWIDWLMKKLWFFFFVSEKDHFTSIKQTVALFTAAWKKGTNI